MNITLPPLRQRGEDILLLAKHFLRQFSQAYETSITGFAAHAEEALLNYYWPGNVRELKHVIERAVLLSDRGVIQASDIRSALGHEPNDAAPPEPVEPLAEEDRAFAFGRIEIPREGLSLKNGERRLIEEVLKLTKWNKSRAAEILRISRPRLKRKIEEYQID
jgi:two-component system response regulator PilR (NtrC family)